MKFLFLALAIVVAYGQPLKQFEDQDLVNRYVVEFFGGVSDKQILHHLSTVIELSKNVSVAFEVHHNYSFGNYRGYAATIEKTISEIIRKDPIVKQVLQDELFKYADCSSQLEARWGLDRIDKLQPEDMDQTFRYGEFLGEGVNAYVIDSGINVAHEEFQGRAVLGPNFIPNTDNTDCNGHGTHVAGLIGSASFGAAKKVTLISVKISPCKGGGPISAVLAGIQWVHQDYQQKQTPSVVNLSLGARLGTFETAIHELIYSGVTVVVAAGNSNADACLISPACVPEAITVAATTIEDIDSNLEDVRSSYSNWGDCVSIFAPGELLESTWWESSTSLKLLSGTSMASPLTAGVVANILSDPQGPKQPYFVKESLLAMAQKGSVDIDCSNTRTPELCNKTPNLFLHVACNSEKMEL